jgi:hypothetical protein
LARIVAYVRRQLYGDGFAIVSGIASHSRARATAALIHQLRHGHHDQLRSDFALSFVLAGVFLPVPPADLQRAKNARR